MLCHWLHNFPILLTVTYISWDVLPLTLLYLTTEKSSLSSHNQAQKINDAYYLERVINNLSNTTAWSVVKAQQTIFGQAGHSSCPIMIPVNFYHKMSIMKCLPIVWVIKRKKKSSVYGPPRTSRLIAPPSLVFVRSVTPIATKGQIMPIFGRAPPLPIKIDTSW